MCDAFLPADTRAGPGACAYQVVEGAASCCGGGGGASEGGGRVSPAAARGAQRPEPLGQCALQSISSTARSQEQQSSADARTAAVFFQEYQGTTHPRTPEPSRYPLTRPLHGTARCLSLAASKGFTSTQTQGECFQRVLRCKGLLDSGGRRRAQLLHS